MRNFLRKTPYAIAPQPVRLKSEVIGRVLGIFLYLGLASAAVSLAGSLLNLLAPHQYQTPLTPGSLANNTTLAFALGRGLKSISPLDDCNARRIRFRQSHG